MNANSAQSLAMARIRDCASVMQTLLASPDYLSSVVNVGEAMTKCLHSGNKILFFGNGGSAADAQHLAAELSGRFLKERPSLSGWALTTNSSVLTAIGNDYSFDEVFARQVQGIGSSGDIAFAITTSGISQCPPSGSSRSRQEARHRRAHWQKRRKVARRRRSLHLHSQRSNASCSRGSHLDWTHSLRVNRRNSIYATMISQTLTLQIMTSQTTILQP